jgi:hypothetical protein
VRTYRGWERARVTDPRAYARKVLVNLRIDRWRTTRQELLTAPETLPEHATPGDLGGIYVQLKDVSWRYNWSYVYLPDGAAPPPTHFPGEQHTRIRDDWWFFRAHAD